MFREPFGFWIKLIEMEYIMRLYLEPNNMTGQSNEKVKVDIHYQLYYDLFKLLKIK